MKQIPQSSILIFIGCCLVVYLWKAIPPNQVPDPGNTVPPHQSAEVPKIIPPDQPSKARLSKLEMSIFDGINRERRSHGLPDLIWREDVALAARLHSENMGNRNFFSHDDPVRGAFDQRMLRSVNGWNLCGENIYKEIGHYDPVRGAVSGWMNSPGHRANILNPNFTHTGIGASFGRDHYLYFTQDFIRQK